MRGLPVLSFIFLSFFSGQLSPCFVRRGDIAVASLLQNNFLVGSGCNSWNDNVMGDYLVFRVDKVIRLRDLTFPYKSLTGF